MKSLIITAWGWLPGGRAAGAAGLLALAALPAARAQAPTTTQNYVLTNTVLVPGKTNVSNVRAMSNFNAGTGALERQQQLTYFDGLGRPGQQVQVQASPAKQDLIVPVAYDALGRPATTYLPYAAGGGGSFQPNALSQQGAFYQANGVLDHVVNDAVPSATNLYEASPLGRPLEQGAPGAAWQPGTRHTLKLNQRANYMNEVRKWAYDETASPACSSPGSYLAGALLVKETRDEQGGLVTEYTTLEGQLIMRKAGGNGIVCSAQPESATLTLTAPAGMGIVGIRSATWGKLLAGSTCDDARFDVNGRADATSYVQSLVASQLNNYPAPQSVSFTVNYWQLGPDPYPGVSKTLLVEALYAPATTPAITDLYTLYIYDALDNLRLVVQPQGLAGYNPANNPYGTMSLGEDFMNTWCFRYDYDGRRRVVRKRVPGGGDVRYVYNQRDQVVLSQDANQAAQGPPQWTFTKYDGQRRPILTGVVTLPPETQTSLQATVDAETVLSESPDPASDIGYTLTNSFPRWTNWGHQSVSAVNVLTITYYDHYYYSRLQNGALAPTVASGQRAGRVEGLVTGTSVRTLGAAGLTSEWLTTATYYDHTYRPLQSLEQNQLGGVTTKTSTYDFSKLLTSSVTQTTSAGQSYAQTNRFTYGPANRLETTYQNTAGQGEVILAHQSYNELGQLMAKRLHNDQPAGAPTSGRFMQKVDYRYNIRGWLTHLNNRDLDNNIEDSPGVYVADPDGGLVEPDLFGLELRYDNMLHGGAAPQFNGNIAQQMWQTRNPNPSGSTQNNVLRTYNYSYDGLNRVTAADYRVWNGATWTSSPAVDFSVSGITYDLNGNILTMKRRGVTNGSNTSPVSGWLDQLKYTYVNSSSANGAFTSGNRLLAVDDAAPGNSSTHDFKDLHSYANTNQIEYGYDANGNLTSDSNRNVSNVQYSLLNQPTQVNIGANRIEYDYSAIGVKLQQRTYTGGSLTKTTYYAGPVVYELPAGADLRPVFAHSTEGRVLYLGSSNSPYGWKYEYHLKDHLGNLRFAFRADRDNGAATQRVGMEPANAAAEEKQAAHVAETRLADPDHARTGSYVARLDAGSGRRQGPSLRLAVRAGDSIRAEVFGRYDRGAAAGRLLPAGALALGAAAAPAAPGLPTETAPLPGTARRGWRPFVGLSLALVPQLLKPKRDELPVAYLRYELFDRDSQLVAIQERPLRRTATDGWQQLVAGTRADSAGFVHISLLNDSREPAYFDDLSARAIAPLAYQENHYDPFGLNLVGIETAGSPNSRFQYNGKEKQDDYNLNWTDYGARMYDATLGRFNTLDRFADKYQDLTPYNYGANNPMRLMDANGDSLQVVVNGVTYSYINHPTKGWGFYSSVGYDMDKDGNMTVVGNAYSGSDPFAQSVSSALGRLIVGQKGNQLVTAMSQNTARTTIVPAGKAGNQTSLSGSTIEWSANNVLGGFDTKGDRTRPGFVGLAHELGHLESIRNGTMSLTPIWGGPYFADDIRATHRENQVRAENGLPLREFYGVKDAGAGASPQFVPDPATRLIQNSSGTYQSIYYDSSGQTNLTPVVPSSTVKPYNYK